MIAMPGSWYRVPSSRQEVDFLIRQVKEPITRSVGVLPEAALEEYREALRAYQRIAGDAR
jgi:hypothetical protein